MESSVETATRALDCKDIIHNIKMKSTANASLSTQLDDLLRKQSEILQISANSLLNAKNHYQGQFMPGGLNDVPTITASTPTKSIAFDNNNTPKQDNSNEAIQDTPTINIKCKDKEEDVQSIEKPNLKQILNKLQLSILNPTDNKSQCIAMYRNEQDDIKTDWNEENHQSHSNGQIRKLWVKGMVLATHFVTAVWLTLKDDIDPNHDLNTPK